jgi:hypothetical protein
MRMMCDSDRAALETALNDWRDDPTKLPELIAAVCEVLDATATFGDPDQKGRPTL